MRAGLVQLTVTDDPAANLGPTLAAIAAAVAGGAQIVLTPECTNALSSSRDHQRAVFHPEETDPTLAALRDAAARAGVWLLIGSLGLKTADADGRFANRSFLVAPDGAIAARCRALEACSTCGGSGFVNSMLHGGSGQDMDPLDCGACRGTGKDCHPRGATGGQP